MKRLRDYLKQHGEEAVRQNLDVIAGGAAWVVPVVLGRCARRRLLAHPQRPRAASSLPHTLRPRLHSLPADLVRRMLEYKAEDRITAAEALRHPFFSLAL